MTTYSFRAADVDADGTIVMQVVKTNFPDLRSCRAAMAAMRDADSPYHTRVLAYWRTDNVWEEIVVVDKEALTNADAEPFLLATP